MKELGGRLWFPGLRISRLNVDFRQTNSLASHLTSPPGTLVYEKKSLDENLLPPWGEKERYDCLCPHLPENRSP